MHLLSLQEWTKTGEGQYEGDGAKILNSVFLRFGDNKNSDFNPIKE